MENQPENYAELYRELADLLGDAAVRKLWRNYGGLTVTFPIRLYSREFTRQYIHDNMDLLKPSEMAREVSLSERRVRQIIREIRGEEREQQKDHESDSRSR